MSRDTRPPWPSDLPIQNDEGIAVLQAPRQMPVYWNDRVVTLAGPGQDHRGTLGQPPGGQFLEVGVDPLRGRVVRGIQEHEVEGLGGCVKETRNVAFDHGDVRRQPGALEIVANCPNRLAGAVDEGGPVGPAGEGLDPRSPGSGVEVEHRRAGNPVRQAREHPLPGPVRDGPRARRDRPKPDPLRATSDDPHAADYTGGRFGPARTAARHEWRS